MSNLLALLGSLLWWVLYGSIFALFFALVAWAVLRWAERCNVVFNRVYLACLLWSLAGMLLVVGVAAHEGMLRPPYVALIASTPLRLALVLDMLLGALLLWRLVPRADARRIRLASACMAVAAVTAIGFGAATSLAG
ncbi:hypothetical protein [Fulvimonas soli]|jgi:hypothetical protein|uniref:Uncharacterized protein n=1 Tax=Fulvimonas soli TaxID=155197 RepID=A0A316HN87_9GAMM|nr:hypothetical protein [Fulvimonas soli]PWK82709.1 hypothetical protein C7456_1156 [Fulvimonas soli]TNY25319.1 hypothetical protein BV497_14515 [Fulvimonas soli]